MTVLQTTEILVEVFFLYGRLMQAFILLFWVMAQKGWDYIAYIS